MDAEFQILQDNFRELLGTAPLSHQKASEIESSLSDALANIANSSPSYGLERMQEILDDLEGAKQNNIDPKKLQRVRQMVDEFGDNFFNEFWAKQFIENTSNAEINDTRGSRSQKVYESDGEGVSEEELSIVPPEAIDQARVFLRKLELTAIYRKKKFKEVLGGWREIAMGRLAQRSEKQWKIFGCFMHVFLNKQKALFELRKKSAEIGGDVGDEDFWRRRFMRPLRDGIALKKNEIDRLKQDLDDIEAENLRLSMHGHQWHPAPQTPDRFFSSGWWRNPLFQDPSHLLEKNDDDLGRFDSNFSRENEMRNPLFDTGNSFRKLHLLPDETDPNQPHHEATSYPFDPHMTQILPDPCLKTQRLDANMTISDFNDEGSLRGKRKDTRTDRLDDSQHSEGVIDSTSQMKSVMPTGTGFRIPTPKFEITKDDPVIGGFEAPQKLNWFTRARMINRLFLRLQKERFWAGFCRLFSKCRASKMSVMGASSRMMARLLMATRQHICGRDLQKDFRRWHMVANPEFAKECLLKFGSRLPIRFQYVIFRMKSLAYKGKTKMEPLKKVVYLSRGLTKLTDVLERNMHEKIRTSWMNVAGSIKKKKMATRKMWGGLSRHYRNALRKHLNALHNLVRLTRFLGQRLVGASIGRMADGLAALRGNLNLFKQATKAARVESMASTVRTREDLSVQNAWQGIKAEFAHKVRIDALKKKVALRMAYLSGSQLFQAMTTLRLHTHKELQLIFNRKNDVLGQFGLRLKANVKAMQAKVVKGLQAHRQKLIADSALADQALQHRKAHCLLTLQKNYASKLLQTIGELQAFSNSKKESQGLFERKKRQAISLLVDCLQTRKNRCFRHLFHFAVERGLASRGGLQTLRQLVSKKQIFEASLAMFKLTLHFYKTLQENRTKDLKVACSLRLMCVMLKFSVMNAIRIVYTAEHRQREQHHTATRTLAGFLSSKPLYDARTALQSLRTINLGFKTNSIAVIGILGAKTRMKVALSLSQFRLNTVKWENRRQKAIQVLQNSAHLERKDLLSHMAFFWHALTSQIFEKTHAKTFSAHKQKGFLLKLAHNCAEKQHYAVIQLFDQARSLRYRTGMEERQKELLKQLKTNRTIQSVSLITKAQLSKFKFAFQAFVDECRKLRTDNQRVVRGKHAVLFAFFNNSTKKLTTALTILRDNNQKGKKEHEAYHHRTNKVLRRLLGAPLTSDFSEINSFHFDAFIRKHKSSAPPEKNTLVQDLKHWFGQNDWKGALQLFLDELQGREYQSAQEFLPPLVDKLEKDARLSTPEFEKLRNAVAAVLKDGRAKNDLIRRKNELEIVCHFGKGSLMIEKLRTSNTPVGIERFECFQEVIENSGLTADAIEMTEKLQSISLRDKVDEAIAKISGQSELVRSFLRTHPVLHDVCMALRTPKYKNELVPVAEIINRKQNRHFQRLMCLISAFLEVFSASKFDIGTLLTRFGVTSAMGLLRFLDMQVADWPFDFLTILKQAANQEFTLVSFRLFNTVIRALTEGENTKLSREDINDILQIFSASEIAEFGLVRPSQVDLFVLLCKKRRLRRLAYCMLSAFYLEDVFAWNCIGPLKCLASLENLDDFDLSTWSSTNSEKYMQIKDKTPDTFEDLVSLAHRYPNDASANQMIEFLHKIKHEKQRLSLVCGYLTSDTLQASPVLSILLSVLNEKGSWNPLLDLIERLAQYSHESAFRKLLNRTFHEGKPMDFTDFVAHLQHTEDRNALRFANAQLEALTDSSERRRLVWLILQDLNCQELHEKLQLHPFPTLADVVSLAMKMENTNGISMIKDKINGILSSGDPDQLAIGNPGFVEAQEYKRKTSNYELTHQTSGLPVSPGRSTMTAYADENSSSLILLRTDNEHMPSMISLNDSSILNSIGNEESEFFRVLKFFLWAYPGDCLSRDLRNGQIAKVSQLKNLLVHSDTPKHVQLLRSLESTLPLRIPEFRTSLHKSDSLLERKSMKKALIALKTLVTFAKENKKQDQSLAKGKKHAILCLKNQIQQLLSSATTLLRQNTFKIASETHQASNWLNQARARLCAAIRSKIVRKQTLALDNLRANARHWILQTRPGISKIIRLVCTIEKRQISHALIHMHRQVSAKWAAAIQISKLLGAVERSRDRHTFDTLKKHSDRLMHSQSHLKLIGMLTNAAKAHQLLIRRHFDILTAKKVRVLLSQFVAKLEGLPGKRKINAFFRIKAVYYREKYRDRIQGLNALMSLVSYQETAALTSAMEVFVKKFRKVNPWFDRVIARMMFVDSITDQNSFWKMRFLGRMKDTIMKPSESLKLKRLAQIVKRGIHKNQSWSFFRLQSKLNAAVRKSQKQLISNN